MPRGVLGGGGGGRVLGRSIKKGALKSWLSLVVGGEKREKLKCMHLGSVFNCFVCLCFFSSVECVKATRMSGNISGEKIMVM